MAALGCGALPLAAADTAKTQKDDKSHKDLVEYILNAHKLGLKEPEIKQNAVKAGWDKGSVEQAFTVVNYLNTTRTATPKPGDKQGQQSLLAGPALSNSTALPGGYKVGPGDEIGIIVWKEGDASVPDTMVRADGKITIPLVKEVAVAGFTPTELES